MLCGDYTGNWKMARIADRNGVRFPCPDTVINFPISLIAIPQENARAAHVIKHDAQTGPTQLIA